MFEGLKENIQTFPSCPGVYLFKDRVGKILYIGKAKNLRKRVQSYFFRFSHLEPSKQIMVQKIASIETAIVDKEIEAFLLEATLIQKNQPPFNVIIRDDSSFSYISISTKDQWPIIERTRHPRKSNARLFGPYQSARAARETLIALKSFFPYPSCAMNREEPCLLGEHGKKIGPILGKTANEKYQKAIGQCVAFLQGRANGLLTKMKNQMKRAAKEYQFERAAILRDQWKRLLAIAEQQKVIFIRRIDCDIITLAREGNTAAVNGLIIRSGKLLHTCNIMLGHPSSADHDEIMGAFLTQYYSKRHDAPKEILVSVMPPMAAMIEKMIRTKIRVPIRGKFRQLLIMGEKNATSYLHQRLLSWKRDEEKWTTIQKGLADLFGCSDTIHRIEGFDVSNIQGKEAVGSMVVFVDGKAKRSEYRKFRIRTIAKPNDVAMMAEMLGRRFHRRNDHWTLPDAIIVDGGKGQINIAHRVLQNKGLNIPVLGLAKREEKIYRVGQQKPIRLNSHSPVLHFFMRGRDEAHRFAITGFHFIHSKRMIQSESDDIEGIGPKTRKKLIMSFGSMKNALNANRGEIENIIGKQKTRIISGVKTISS